MSPEDTGSEGDSMLLIAIPVGLLIGLSLGTLGGGGSILTVPALVYALGQSPHTATTSSLLIVGVTSLIGLIPHARAGRVRVIQGVAFGCLGVLGSFVGSALSAAVPAAVLLSAFAGLVLVVAVVMLYRENHGSARATDDRARVALWPLREHPGEVVRVVVAASVVGVLTGFFGVGGGFVLVPALTLALGFPMPVAVGTSLLVIVINSFTALTFRAGNGISMDWPVIGTFVTAAVVGSLLGGRLAGRLSVRRLTTAFAVLLMAVGVFTGTNSILHLW